MVLSRLQVDPPEQEGQPSSYVRSKYIGPPDASPVLGTAANG